MAKAALWIKIHPDSVERPAAMDYLNFDGVTRIWVLRDALFDATPEAESFSLNAKMDAAGGLEVVELFAGTKQDCQDRMNLIWGALHQISKRKKGNFFLADMDMCAWLPVSSASEFG
jgi:hypothetical protein